VDAPAGGEIGALASSFRSLLGELREKQVMEKFLSKSAAEMIQKTDPGVAGTGERRPVTVLFSDLKAHAAFKEGSEDPKEVLRRVNASLSRQAELVEPYGGQVDKFVGDRMMAIFKGEDRCGRRFAVPYPSSICSTPTATRRPSFPASGFPPETPSSAPWGARTASTIASSAARSRRGQARRRSLPGDMLLSEAYARCGSRLRRSAAA
jgi:class 3 adenylate cyclase